MTAATGTVGRDVVEGLLAAGADLRAASRDPQRAAASLPAGARTVRFDLADRGTWQPPLEGVRAVFLVRPPEQARARQGLLPFVDAVVAAGVQRVVFLSVQGAGRNRLLPHRAVEDHLRRSGTAWTFLRAGYFLQNLVTVHRAEIRDRGEIFVPAGSGRTAFVDTRDVAEVAVRALTQPGHERRAHELTGSEAPTYDDVAAVLTEVLGRPVRCARPGPVEYVREQLRRGMPPPLVLVTLVLYTTARLGLAGHLSDDLARVLGRPPRTVRDFVRDHADAWRPAGRDRS
ncbi:Uncharacterized conserved protein YbjT, contains NAD(P)-binding and DUF2867 domains [Quadrisphaera sp. DSM 44207]|nr:Uncharacterized conserved protein YbjT, contains NAD(P)-binding and DUF2867 domains [Quadrisphaera sp. DSM 44207]